VQPPAWPGRYLSSLVTRFPDLSLATEGRIARAVYSTMALPREKNKSHWAPMLGMPSLVPTSCARRFAKPKQYCNANTAGWFFPKRSGREAPVGRQSSKTPGSLTPSAANSSGPDAIRPTEDESADPFHRSYCSGGADVAHVRVRQLLSSKKSQAVRTLRPFAKRCCRRKRNLLY
jgi:hypothetical protein